MATNHRLLFLFLVCLFACQSQSQNKVETKKEAEIKKTSLQQAPATVNNRGANIENWWDHLPRAAWGQFKEIPTPSNWFDVYQITSSISD